jgi:hypothetical protein
MDSCRGFLMTTRGRAVIEECVFTRTAMSAILIEDDAEGWFESGLIRNLTVRNNVFVDCAEPVIHINPQNSASNASLPVHQNIRIENNRFEGGGIRARSVEGLEITGNTFTSTHLPLSTDTCSAVRISDNLTGMPKKP